VKIYSNFNEARDERRRNLELARATENQMTKLRVVSEQEGAHVGPRVMEGQLLYAIDESTLKS